MTLHIGALSSDQPAVGAPSARTGRFRELDGLRGVAVALVALGHFSLSVDQFYPDLTPSGWAFEYGAWGVQLFFLISGYVILLTASRSPRPRDFLIARAARLYPTYWVALASSALLLLLLPHPPFAITGGQVAVNATMLQRFLMVADVDPVYWTLAVELIFYAAMYVLLVVRRAQRADLDDRVVTRAAAAWVTIAVAAAVWGAGRPLTTPVKIVLNLTAAEFAPLFATGMLLYLSRRDGRLHPLTLPFGGAAVLTSTLLHNPVSGVMIGLLVLLFLTVTTAPSVPVLASGPLHFLGRISYSYYLLHTVTGFALVYELTPRIGRPAAMLIATAVTLLLAWASYRWVEGSLSRRFRGALNRVAGPPPSRPDATRRVRA